MLCLVASSSPNHCSADGRLALRERFERATGVRRGRCAWRIGHAPRHAAWRIRPRLLRPCSTTRSTTPRWPAAPRPSTASCWPGSGLPQVAKVTAAVVHALVDVGIAPDGISVLQSQAGRQPGNGDPCRLLGPPLRERIALLTHDPNDRRQLAYLAASEAGEAILINRALHEADLVLPVGCLRGDESAGYFGIHGAIFPTFSDAKTIQRFRGFGSLNGRGSRHRELNGRSGPRRLAAGRELHNPAHSGGRRSGAARAGRRKQVPCAGGEGSCITAAWSWPASAPGQPCGGRYRRRGCQQTWDNVGRAIQAAGHFVEDGGSIALCCDLADPPGPAMQALAERSSREAALRQMGNHRPVDALPAAQLAPPWIATRSTC